MLNLEFMSTIAWQIVVGGVVGLIVGYLLRKVTIIFALFLGLGAIVTSFFAYRGIAYRWIITALYTALKDWALKFTGGTS